MNQEIEVDPTTCRRTLVQRILSGAHVTDQIKIASSLTRRKTTIPLIKVITEPLTRDITSISIIKRDHHIEQFKNLQLKDKRCIIKGGGVALTLALATYRQELEQELAVADKKERKRLLNRFTDMQRQDRGRFQRRKQQILAWEYVGQMDLGNADTLEKVGKKLKATLVIVSKEGYVKGSYVRGQGEEEDPFTIIQMETTSNIVGVYGFVLPAMLQAFGNLIANGKK